MFKLFNFLLLLLLCFMAGVKNVFATVMKGYKSLFSVAPIPYKMEYNFQANGSDLNTFNSPNEDILNIIVPGVSVLKYPMVLG